MRIGMCVREAFMYEEYWGLRQSPFRNEHDLTFLFVSEGVDETLARLAYAIENVLALATLSGVSGVGKTMLLHELKAQVVRRGSLLALLANAGDGPIELLSGIVKAFGHSPAGETVRALLDQIRELARQNHRLRRQSVVVVDEAECLSDPAALLALRALTNLEHDGARLLTVILSGQPQLAGMLDTSPVLRQRLELTAELESFSPGELADYVGARLAAAGSEANPFTDEALDEMFAVTRGIPRNINLCADMALLNAAGEGLEKIGKETIVAAREELFGSSAPS